MVIVKQVKSFITGKKTKFFSKQPFLKKHFKKKISCKEIQALTDSLNTDSTVPLTQDP